MVLAASAGGQPPRSAPAGPPEAEAGLLELPTLDEGYRSRLEASAAAADPAARPAPPPAPAARVEPSAPLLEPPPPATGTAIVGSYFGPGLFGNRTACGQTLTTALAGVAHRALPCGSLVTLAHGGAVVTVPVVDRGPFHDAREFDLTYATKTALGCPDLCRLVWLR